MGSRPSNRPVFWQQPFPSQQPLLFVIPSEAEGSAAPRTFPGKASYTFCTTAAFSAWPTIVCASSSICSRCCWLRKLSA
jgi:hypothetical protein